MFIFIFKKKLTLLKHQEIVWLLNFFQWQIDTHLVQCMWDWVNQKCDSMMNQQLRDTEEYNISGFKFKNNTCH